MTRARAGAVPAPTTRVSTFELFFDLVFVLTIARIGVVLHEESDLVGLAAMFLILANTWWMYFGYAWLTSRIDAAGLVWRLALFVGMGGFLVMALAAPEALGDDGLLFGLAYLVVLLVYLGLFRAAFPRGSSRTFWQVAPWNLASAGLLIVAGFVEGAADWWLWTGAVALHVVQHEFGRVGDFPFFADRPMPAARFVERHGIVLIVALSDSMLALALGVGDRVVTSPIVLAGLLTLALAAAMWALYFVDTDETTRRALEAAPSGRVIRIAERAFAYSFVPILGGILVVSTGLEELLKDPLAPLSLAGAGFLAGGAILYVLGVTALRQSIAAAGVRRWIAALATAGCVRPPGGSARSQPPSSRSPCSPSLSWRSRRSPTAIDQARLAPRPNAQDPRHAGALARVCGGRLTGTVHVRTVSSEVSPWMRAHDPACEGASAVQGPQDACSAARAPPGQRRSATGDGAQVDAGRLGRTCSDAGPSDVHARTTKALRLVQRPGNRHVHAVSCIRRPAERFRLAGPQRRAHPGGPARRLVLALPAHRALRGGDLRELGVRVPPDGLVRPVDRLPRAARLARVETARPDRQTRRRPVQGRDGLASPVPHSRLGACCLPQQPFPRAVPVLRACRSWGT